MPRVGPSTCSAQSSISRYSWASGLALNFAIFCRPFSSIAHDRRRARSPGSGEARVRFRYRDPYGGETTRVIEPYRVLARAGRYYLIGYDTQPRKGWRYFAIDRIVAPPTRAGSFTPRAIPLAYLTCDAIGMLQRGGAATEVTIRLSPVIAESIVSRRWQKSQRVKRRGSAEVTLTVADVDEAVRWALGFGAEARVVAPPRAVESARRVLDEMRRQYQGAVDGRVRAQHKTAT